MTIALVLAGEADAGQQQQMLCGQLAALGVRRVDVAERTGPGLLTVAPAARAARDMACWAAWRQLTPGALYGISLGLGLVAAIWFAQLAVHAKLLALPALAGSFLFARTGSLLAATSPEGRIRPVVGWLGTACGLLTETALYAALAVSARLGASAGLDGTFGSALRNTFVATWGGAGAAGVWRLAIAALLLLGVRKLAELGYQHTAGAPGDLFPRSVLRTVEQAVTFPAGERYVVIALTSVFFGPRLTFLILLGWGVLAAGYLLAGRIARSAAWSREAREPGDDEDNGLAAYRGDGGLASWGGALFDGRLPPLPPLLAGLLVTGVLVALGLGNLPGILVLTPIEVMMLAALGAKHPHDGRLDWLVPALLLAGEGVFLAALGLARHVTPWVVFALLAAVLVRHVDLACRARAGRGIGPDVLGLGWEGRMLLAGVAAAAGIVPFAYAVLSGYLWLLFIWDFLTGCLVPTEPGSTDPGPTDGDDA